MNFLLAWMGLWRLFLLRYFCTILLQNILQSSYDACCLDKCIRIYYLLSICICLDNRNDSLVQMAISSCVSPIKKSQIFNLAFNIRSLLEIFRYTKFLILQKFSFRLEQYIQLHHQLLCQLKLLQVEMIMKFYFH